MTYSIDIINLSIYHYNLGLKKIQICKSLNITNKTFYIWYNKYNYYYINNIQLTYTNYNEIKNQQVHKSTKKSKYSSLIVDYVNNNIGCSLYDINKDITQNNISLSTICRILKENRITRKKINTRIVCKDIDKIELDRHNFSLNIDDTFYDYISIDESSFCIDYTKTKGYSKISVEIKKLIKHKHNKLRYSLLSAINTKGVVCYKICYGSVNGNVYRQFIEDNKHLFINKIIFHDNVRFHHSKVLKEYCSENKIILKYTPAYTPEFNPIELFFSNVKQHYKKLDHTDLINDIEVSINKTNTTVNFKNYYDHVYNIIQHYKVQPKLN
jgi:transposase